MVGGLDPVLLGSHAFQAPGGEAHSTGHTPKPGSVMCRDYRARQLWWGEWRIGGLIDVISGHAQSWVGLRPL